MEETKLCAIFAYRGDANYHLRDAIGSKIYVRRSVAEKHADNWNKSSAMLGANPQGYVVRGYSYFKTDGVLINSNGYVTLA